VYVSQVSIEDEESAFGEHRNAGRGVPKWSLVEADSRIAWFPNKEQPPFGISYCDHVAYPVAQYEDETDVAGIFQMARKIWIKYQDAKSGKAEYPGLIKALENKMNSVPKTLGDLRERLQSLLNE
jgi:hypothetical protein